MGNLLPPQAFYIPNKWGENKMVNGPSSTINCSTALLSAGPPLPLISLSHGGQGSACPLRWPHLAAGTLASLNSDALRFLLPASVDTAESTASLSCDDDHTPVLGEHDKPYHSAYGGGGSTVCLWSLVDPVFFSVSSSNLSHHPWL
ncbi:hypothetical protein BHE74_00002664 [Ensete ventricosum]|nr:hypothetical protein BHE74_00002664 [Ensete ventricosum]